MIVKTRGIVIKYLKYQESSIIVQIFTEDFGLRSFMVNGIRSPRSKRSIGYFQPFSLLELVAYIHPGREIQRLSEYKYFAPVHHIQQDIRKSTIILFLAEILGKLLVNEPMEEHKSLFQYLVKSVMTFEAMEKEIENFHLHFLLKLLPYIGLEVKDGEGLVASMDMDIADHDGPLLEFISTILKTPVTEPVSGSGQVRYRALELVLRYFRHHSSGFGDIKSLKVLHQVFL